ncbi:MAG TPA: hypothetical protein VF743_01475, partial [Acidimicrobiales bacterium]
MTDFVEDVGDAVGETVTDVADTAYDSVGTVAETAYDTVSQGVVGDVIAGVAEVVDTSTFGLAGETLNVADDYVFDTVDYLTAGTVDVDFDDGAFTVSTGIDGVAQLGASVGEDGITTSGEALVGGNFELGMTHDGFTAGAAAGIDWGPLPYAEGHVELDANGDVSVNGRAQGTIPTYAGIFSGETSAGFESTADGWGTYLDSSGAWHMPNGVTLSGGSNVAYEEGPDGSHLAVGVNGAVSYQGIASVGGGVGYERLEHDGDVVEGVHVEGQATAFGVSAEAEADYRHAQIGDREASDWSGDYDIDGPSAASVLKQVAQVAQSQLGDDSGVADAIGAVVDAGGADVLGGLADSGIAALTADPVADAGVAQSAVTVPDAGGAGV